jgi:hypothetical protein
VHVHGTPRGPDHVLVVAVWGTVKGAGPDLTGIPPEKQGIGPPMIPGPLH